MIQKRLGYAGLAGSIALSSFAYAQPFIRINEIVVDPQQDWNRDGQITPSDEWFEIYNPSAQPFNLYGIELALLDTTPNGLSLTQFGFLNPGERLMILNPEGMQNNDGRIELNDIVNNVLIDGFSYGNWPGNTAAIPNGNAHGFYDESLSRFPDGGIEFAKTYATYNSANVPLPSTTLIGGLAGILVAQRRRR